MTSQEQRWEPERLTRLIRSRTLLVDEQKDLSRRTEENTRAIQEIDTAITDEESRL